MQFTNTKKFDTCRHRSLEKEEIGDLTCCKNTLREGYICFRLNIEGLEPVACEECGFYKERLIESFE